MAPFYFSRTFEIRQTPGRIPMKRNRLIFYAVFAVFHLFLVFFTIYVESNKGNILFLSKMLEWIALTKYGAMLGLVLLVVDFVWVRSSNKSHEKEITALNSELNTLKAKLFDLQENAKISPAPKGVK